MWHSWAARVSASASLYRLIQSQVSTLHARQERRKWLTWYISSLLVRSSLVRRTEVPRLRQASGRRRPRTKRAKHMHSG
ncbi:hypothetical protein CPB86DRAFT_399430 [Serendipita vermifera]|nr:hypothetical protein CPB86DRAFT_399430 [Serendipita vermifera]